MTYSTLLLGSYSTSSENLLDYFKKLLDSCSTCSKNLLEFHWIDLKNYSTLTRLAQKTYSTCFKSLLLLNLFNRFTRLPTLLILDLLNSRILLCTRLNTRLTRLHTQLL